MIYQCNYATILHIKRELYKTLGAVLMKLFTFFCCCRQNRKSIFLSEIDNIRKEADLLASKCRSILMESRLRPQPGLIINVKERLKGAKEEFVALDQMMYIALCHRLGLGVVFPMIEIDFSQLDEREKDKLEIIRRLFQSISTYHRWINSPGYVGFQVPAPPVADAFVASGEPRKPRVSCLGDVILSVSLSSSDAEVSDQHAPPVSASPNSELSCMI